jgi:beta-glucosidase
VTIAGRGTLFINGKAAIDLMDPPPGESFFGLGTANLRVTVPGLKSGKHVPLELRMSNESFFAAGGAPFTTRGGIRMGSIKVIEPEKAIAQAASIARDADGKCLYHLSNIISE